MKETSSSLEGSRTTGKIKVGRGSKVVATSKTVAGKIEAGKISKGPTSRTGSKGLRKTAIIINSGQIKIPIVIAGIKNNRPLKSNVRFLSLAFLLL